MTTSRLIIWSATSALLFAGALACGIALNLIIPPPSGGSWIIWSALLSGGLTLGACAVTIAVAVLYRLVVIDIRERDASGG